MVGELDRLRAERDRYRQRAIEQEREAARVRAARDFWKDTARDTAASVGRLRKERDEARAESLEAAHQLQDAFEDIERLERQSAAWKRAAKKWWGKRGEREFDRAYEALVDGVMARLDQFGVPRSPDETPAGFKAYYGPLKRVELLAAELKKTRGAGMAATQDAMKWRDRYREMKAANDRHHGYWIDAIQGRDKWIERANASQDARAEEWEERQRLKRWAVQGRRLHKAIEGALNRAEITRLPPVVAVWLRDLVRRYREGEL